MTEVKIKIKREEEKRVTVAFSRPTYHGTALIIDGKLETIKLEPMAHGFYRWFKTKEALALLLRFLKAIEKEILYGEEDA